MPQGAALFEFDMKMGPMFDFSIPSDLGVTQDETMVLFTTRTLVDEGFTGVKVKDRTWVTYLNPPYLYCILLAPTEHQNDFEEPMMEVLQHFHPESKVSHDQFKDLYEKILSRVGVRLREKIATEPEVQRILALIQSLREPLRPRWSVDTGFCYPEAEKATDLSTAETNSLLDTMNTAGLIKGRICGNLGICPQCSSHRIILHASCPKCGLPTLESGIAMEHFSCEHTAFIEKFSTPTGLVCPQCRTYLSPGTYRTLGKVFHCVMCDSYRTQPAQIMGCVECKGTFATERVKYLSIYCYSATKHDSAS